VPLTLGSLFDGIGVFPLAARHCGVTPLWASEISQSAISITKRHFPQMAHLGSITALHGGKIPPVDVLTFGSPCQNLSLSGKREGLGGQQSSLFFEAVRIIEEMRCATNGIYPAITIWENVVGAFSSNDRLDFAAVLGAFTRTQIPVPSSGRWATAGMVRGYTPDLAWRTLGAHHFGIPQKRRRIFLVCDYRAQRAAQILFDPEGLHPVFQAGAAGGLAAAPGPGSGPAAAGWPPAEIYALQGRKLRGAAVTKDRGQFYGGFGRPNDAVPTLLTDDALVIFVHFPGKPQDGYVRRLTPAEYEKLMGLPTGWTKTGYDGRRISDTARYTALGNSIAVPCAVYVMERIVKVLEEKAV
jgi:DNA (cytosine-5)-methyltransferase 1